MKKNTLKVISRLSLSVVMAAVSVLSSIASPVEVNVSCELTAGDRALPAASHMVKPAHMRGIAKPKVQNAAGPETVYTATQSTQDNRAQGPEINIIINQNVVRFTSPTEIPEWHVEVTNQKGEVIFDSGLVTGASIEWLLRNQQGEAAESGLYAYTLTIKDPAGGAPRIRRGHVILDRASNTDRVWVTSNSTVGVGGESRSSQVTVTGSGEMTIGGAQMPEADDRSTGAKREGIARQASDRAVDTKEPETGVSRDKKPPASASSTAATTLVDDIQFTDVGADNPRDIHLSNNNAGLRFYGTTAPLTASPTGAAIQFWGNNSPHFPGQLYLDSGAHNNAALIFRTAMDGGVISERMRVAASGNVGIGTTSPGTKLMVVGANATVNVETSEVLRLQRGAVSGIKNRNTAGFSVGSFEPGIIGRTRLDINLSGIPNSSNVFADIPDITVMSLLANGNVGIGTINPGAKLHVSGADGNLALIAGASSGIVFQSNPGSNDIIGRNANNTAYADLHLRAGAGPGVYINTAGNVGIGTTNPGFRLDVAGDAFGIYGRTAQGTGLTPGFLGSAGIWGDSKDNTGVVGTSTTGHGVHGITQFENCLDCPPKDIAGVTGESYGHTFAASGVLGVAAGGYGVKAMSNEGTGLFAQGAVSAGFFNGKVVVNGNLCATNLPCSSDARLKQKITNLGYGLREVLQLRPVTWVWRDKPDGKTQLGLIAQEVEPLMPELVDHEKDEARTLGLNYIGLIPVMIQAIQEQQAALRGKEDEVMALKAENATLNTRLTTLEKTMRQFKKQRQKVPR
jgi:hypothetical protein